jgi:hypothetical protein
MKISKKWGIIGAVLFVLIGVLCAFIPDASILHNTILHISVFVCYPIDSAWRVFFSAFGIQGEAGWAMLPYLATLFLYLGALGFGVGALCSWIAKPR